MLVAAAILGFCVVPVMAVSQRGVTEAAALRDELLSRQILIDLCERYKDADPPELLKVAANPALIAADPLLLPLNHVDAPRGLERRLSLVRDLDGATGLHQLSFEVTWNDRNGRRRQLSLDRLIHAH